MGCRELIASLRKEGEEKILNLWREAEDTAGRIYTEAALRLEEVSRTSTVERAGGDTLQQLLLEAETKVRYVRLTSSDKLSRRLYALAASSVYLLREHHYDDIFEKLVQELPCAEWRRVCVNPADQGIAEKFFPEAHIVTDRSITGGMEAETEEGSIRVVNTFEKRLERIWPRMLPELLDDLAHYLTDGEERGGGT